jgi:spore germination cell wall hydrolase CwlJ-like protein
MMKMTTHFWFFAAIFGLSIMALARPAAANTGEEGLADEITCLALHIYHEARGETLRGRVAVAAVVLNRVNDHRFPPTICGVIKQGGERRYRCQMTWYCDGRSDQPNEETSWNDARMLAVALVFGFGEDPTEGALWYADYVTPGWASRLHPTNTIGRHIYYRDLEG